MKRQIALILFFLILALVILISAYRIVFANQNKLRNLNSEDAKYYKTFGESCLDRVTDDYLRNVCEKINNSAKRDICYYNEGISAGYSRICKLIENTTLSKRCFIGVNVTLSNNKSLKQRADKYNPNKRKI